MQPTRKPKPAREKPTSLDTVTMISLNTTIACHGGDRAESAYLKWCRDSEYPAEEWVLRYFRLYLRYRKKPDNPLSNYIDLPASQRALEEA